MIMAIDYPVKLDIHLRPVWHDNPPNINIGINNDIQQIILSEEHIFHYEFIANTSSTLTVELLNKIDSDTVPDKGLDKAVIIESVSFFGISDPKFAWAGVYEPKYPEPWATEQRDQGVVLKQHLSPHTYLGFNGKWTLTFTVPVFTWMHRVKDLGWIYD
jgi:hypothetical protein